MLWSVLLLVVVAVVGVLLCCWLHVVLCRLWCGTSQVWCPLMVV